MRQTAEGSGSVGRTECQKAVRGPVFRRSPQARPRQAPGKVVSPRGARLPTADVPALREALLRSGSLDPGHNEALRVAWLAAVHESVRVAGGGLIGEALKPAAGRNYYAVSVEFHRGVSGVVM